MGTFVHPFPPFMNVIKTINPKNIYKSITVFEIFATFFYFLVKINGERYMLNDDNDDKNCDNNCNDNKNYFLHSMVLFCLL